MNNSSKIVVWISNFGKWVPLNCILRRSWCSKWYVWYIVCIWYIIKYQVLQSDKSCKANEVMQSEMFQCKVENILWSPTAGHSPIKIRFITHPLKTEWSSSVCSMKCCILMCCISNKKEFDSNALSSAKIFEVTSSLRNF